MMNRVNQRAEWFERENANGNDVNRGFRSIEVSDESEMLSPGPVARRFIREDSKGILIRSEQANQKLYDKTKFGMLLVEVHENSHLLGIDSMSQNQLLGYPSVESTTKHGKNQWSTMILLTKDERVFVVEAAHDKPLNKQDLDDLRSLVEETISTYE